MTPEQVKILKLGIEPINERVVLIVESALQWVQDNTTLKFDINNNDDLEALPACVRLFAVKFFDVNNINAGVSSESIEGLSLSFSNGDRDALIWQFARELLGAYLISGAKFVVATSRWE